MSFSNLAKGGWHPKGKDGGKESWRGDFKGINQIANKFGKGRESSSAAEESRNHQSTPLSALKDPSLFAPPPKHIGYHGGVAAPNTITPDRRGWGNPASGEAAAPQMALQSQAQLDAEEEAQRPAPPPVPYRADTTGLKTDNLPKPPVRRAAPVEEMLPPQPTRPLASTGGAPLPQSKPQPPPRLPPRQNSHPDAYSQAPPPAYSPPPTVGASKQSGGYLNQASLNRLGQAGVSVPGFDIGQVRTPTSPPPAIEQRAPTAPASHMSDLQSRFTRMTTSPSQSQPVGPTSPTAPSNGGTTWAQKQKALQTAASFHQNPSSISFSDAKDAASTANNFRQRHGDQVASGWKTAQKYGVADKIGGAVGTMSSERESGNAEVQRPGMGSAQTSASTLASVAVAAAKKAPPPPPKKKNLMVGGADVQHEDTGAPPPIPLASKPR